MSPENGKPRLLLVDDQPQLFKQLGSVLEDEFSIHVADGGPHALNLVQEILPDLIIADIIMPVLDGIGLLKALRSDARTRAIPVILVSGEASDEARILGFEIGADGYLDKPFTVRELRARIRTTLDSTKLRVATARAQALAEARAIEARERAAILESVTDGFYALDSQWRVTYSNQGALDHFGLAREDLVGRVYWDCLPSNKGTVLEQQFRRAMTEQTASRFEYFTPVSRTWIQVHAYPMPQGLAVNFHDISERKRAEQELLLHSRVLENMSEGVIVTDEAGCIVYSNSAQERMFGYGPGELLGQHHSIHDAGTLEENAALLREINEQVQRGGTWTGERYNRCKNSETLYTYVRITAVDREDQRFWVWVQRDVTAEKVAAEALREREERFRLMADTAPVLIWVTDENMEHLWVNGPWLRFTGRALHEAQGQGWMQSVHPEDRAACLEQYQLSLQQRTSFSVEYRLRRADGEYRRMLDTGVPLYEGAARAFSGFVGSCIDISEITQAAIEREHALRIEREARDEAERLSRLKDEFLATLSHELRTPLNSIHGWAGILRRRGPKDPDMEQGLEVIERNARAQATIINDLLDMNRIVSGLIRLELRILNLHEVVHIALDAIAPAAAAKRLRIQSTLDSRVGTIRGDPERLQQILWNLLSNAVKFTPEGGCIQVVLEQVNSHMEISIQDNGAGITHEFLPYVFDRFRQADASISRRSGGLGLGLSIVKSLVELHGGSVHAKSGGLNLGSTFIVSLPIAAVETDLTAPHQPLTPAPNTEVPEVPWLTGLRVLAIDDDPDALGLLARILGTGELESSWLLAPRRRCAASSRKDPMC